MSRLSAQSIRNMSLGHRPMIAPFSDDKVIVNGMSYGLSAASYDLTIDHDLQLGMHPGFLLADLLRSEDDVTKALCMFKEELPPPPFGTGVTEQRLIIPDNIAALVVNKSTYGRLHCVQHGTYVDPGFEGFLTLELVNLSDRPVFIRAGDPIVQLVFDWLDMPTDRPYRGSPGRRPGKYHDQPRRPVGAILEDQEGTKP